MNEVLDLNEVGEAYNTVMDMVLFLHNRYAPKDWDVRLVITSTGKPTIQATHITDARRNLFTEQSITELASMFKDGVNGVQSYIDLFDQELAG